MNHKQSLNNLDINGKIKLDFAVIGAGVAGLSCAIALRRIGHNVTVLEQNTDMSDLKPGRGVRLPPNLTKILILWGLSEQLHAISVKSEAIHVLLAKTGELLGTQHWDEELLRETRGEYLFAHLSDLVKLLYDVAISRGANIRLGTRAISIDPQNGTIETAAGETVHADVIVGADGISGLARRALLQEEGVRKPADKHSMWMYSGTVPRETLINNPHVKGLDDRVHNTLFVWMGCGRSAVGYPVGGSEDFAVCAYGPYSPKSSLGGGIEEFVGREGDTEPQFKNLLPLLSSLRRTPVTACEPLEDWVSDSGRLVIIGKAAHPIPPGSIQECAMDIEDGAVFARLFTHLLTRDQISQFLWAFQEVRQPRCAAAIVSETNIMYFTCMPPGPEQKARDRAFREKRDAGLDALQAGADQEETPEWREVKEVFGYDAEDEADNWWVSWGCLKFKSASSTVSLPPIQVAQIIN